MAELTQEHANTVKAFLLKFQGLGMRADLLRIEPGPIVTSYHFRPHNSIPLTKILNKSEDFAFAARVEKVTIQRIKGEIVIFAANESRSYVDFKDYLTWYMQSPDVDDMFLAIPLGIDTMGVKTAIDLTTCPHILLAGSTGSGKSVLESAIISCLAVRYLPSELELILVDTKKLDLPLFSCLPHVGHVCDTLEAYLKMMASLLQECQLRLSTLQGCACRNISEYRAMCIGPMSYKVLIIDEFADLLAQDKEAKREKFSIANDFPSASETLKRVVQIGRAAGIHVIAGTQRTSVKVIDGDIKNNFPTRISLQVPTRFDSNTILGEGGAETLLGRGDMMVKSNSSEVLKRYHGPFVRQEDIMYVISRLEDVRGMLGRR